MSPHENAVLLQRGVTFDTITALERAGITTLAQLADRNGEQLADVPGIGMRRAATVVRALGRLADIELAAVRTTHP